MTSSLTRLPHFSSVTLKSWVEPGDEASEDPYHYELSSIIETELLVVMWWQDG